MKQHDGVAVPTKVLSALVQALNQVPDTRINHPDYTSTYVLASELRRLTQITQEVDPYDPASP